MKFSFGVQNSLVETADVQFSCTNWPINFTWKTSVNAFLWSVHVVCLLFCIFPCCIQVLFVFIAYQYIKKVVTKNSLEFFSIDFKKRVESLKSQNVWDLEKSDLSFIWKSLLLKAVRTWLCQIQSVSFFTLPMNLHTLQLSFTTSLCFFLIV